MKIIGSNYGHQHPARGRSTLATGLVRDGPDRRTSRNSKFRSLEVVSLDLYMPGFINVSPAVSEQ